MGEVIAHLAMSLDGATVVGRRLYDITNGWNGHPGGETPMVVVTHRPPQDWPRDGVPIFFESSVEAAVAKARELADGQDVSIAGATITCGCLEAGLLDAIQVSLVPVILGDGIPWLAGTRGPVRLLHADERCSLRSTEPDERARMGEEDPLFRSAEQFLM